MMHTKGEDKVIRLLNANEIECRPEREKDKDWCGLHSLALQRRSRYETA